MISLKFEFEKETKGAVRYKEVTRRGIVIGTLYIRKTHFGHGNYPNCLKVTFETIASDKEV